ncbi:hypothetical protein SUGI_0552380 [Cryptomeria japonica]|nr:hypothetical protein SUGI_0552380 [Cryptomeria japonica]
MNAAPMRVEPSSCGEWQGVTDQTFQQIQGVEPATTYGNLGLPPDRYSVLEWVYPTWARKHALDIGETVSHLKGAIVTADRFLTVSEGYAWEITNE